MIYLATPYFHEDSTIRHFRFLTASRIAGRLIASGQHVFCPIAHSHSIAAEWELPKGFDYWREYDMWFLSRCDKVLVVKMHGWEQSKGVQAEIEMATKLGIPVEYIEP